MVFGVHNFTNNDDETLGQLVLAPGRSFTLRYRVLLHVGDEVEGSIADAFVEYAKTEKFDELGKPESVGAQ